MIGIFPCRKCLLLPCCSYDCEKVTKKNDDVKRQELDKGVCPNCGSEVTPYQKAYASNDMVWNCVECNLCKNVFSYTGKILITKKMIDEAFEPVKIVNGI